MNGSLEMLFLLVLMVTVTIAQRSEGGGQPPDYDEEEPCLTETKYINISSINTKDITNNIKDHLTDIKNDLMTKASDTEMIIHGNQHELQTNLNQTKVTLDSLSTHSKEVLDAINAITKNITDYVKQRLDVDSISITDKLSGIRNQTIANFDSINENVPLLASKSATEDIMAEIKKLATVDIIKGIQQHLPSKSDLNHVSSNLSELLKLQKNEILSKTQNDTSHLEKQLSSIITEQEAIKVLINGIESSELPPAQENKQTDEIEILHTNEHICNVTEHIFELSNLIKTSKIEITTNLSDKKTDIMESLKEIKELMKKQGNDKTAETAGQHSEPQIKRTFDPTFIIVIFSAVGLVILFVLVCVVLRRMGNLHSKLEHIQIQVAHEKYYKRDNSVTGLQLPKYEEQKNGRENLKINMYQDTELTEDLMPKHES